MTKVDALVALAAGLSIADLHELRERLAHLARHDPHPPTAVADLGQAETVARPDPACDYRHRRDVPPPGKAWRDFASDG
jgi:hypothetical protein